jgi:predicted Zn-dependent protease
MKRAFLFLACVACVPTRLAPVGPGPAPLTSNDARLEEDERALWHRAEEEEKRLSGAGVLYDDAALVAYLDALTVRLATPAGFGGFSFHVHVLRNANLGAFTLPNGFIYVTVGFLARMDDEAQLATVLAHEMTHALYRHGAREYRDLKNATTVAVVVPVFGPLAAYSSVRGFSREMETEADEVGFGMVAKAGYDVAECPKLFQKLQQELRDAHETEPFYFGTHPALAARIENYKRLIAAQPAREGVRADDPFLGNTRAVVLETARLDLQGGRMISAERNLLKYLAMDAGSAKATFLLGELKRQKPEPDGALEQYRKAVALDPAYPAPWRAMGLVLMKRGEKPAARAALLKYLELAPKADDRAYVEHDLEALQ